LVAAFNLGTCTPWGWYIITKTCQNSAFIICMYWILCIWFISQTNTLIFSAFCFKVVCRTAMFKAQFWQKHPTSMSSTFTPIDIPDFFLPGWTITLCHSSFDLFPVTLFRVNWACQVPHQLICGWATTKITVTYLTYLNALVNDQPNLLCKMGTVRNLKYHIYPDMTTLSLIFNSRGNTYTEHAELYTQL